MLGARTFEVPLCNYWPGWGIRLIDPWRPAASPMCSARWCARRCRSAKLWVEIERIFTGGDSNLDRLCMS
jgi:hypothetical protein